MNLTIENKAGKVFASLYGIDTDCNWCLYNFSSNTLDICVTGQTVAMDYMTPLGTGLTASNLPALASGIILFSYEKLPNDFAVVADGNGVAVIQCPSYLTGTTDFDTIFNVVEFTLTANTPTAIVPAVWVDITNVDFFSTPIELHLTGSNPSGGYDERKGAMKEDRDKIFSDYIAATKGTCFESLAISGANGNIRIVGPQHGVAMSLIPDNYWDSYVSSIWSFYETNILTATTSYGTYTGEVVSNILTLTNTNGLGECYNFSMPTSAADIFGCAGVLAAPNNAEGALAAVIGAAINRSTLMSSLDQPDCVVSDYYKLTGSTNLYAAVLHKAYVDGTTYAFPFDDVCNGSSTLSCTTPEQLTITLNKI